MKKILLVLCFTLIFGATFMPAMAGDDWLMPHVKIKLKNQLKTSSVIVYKDGFTQVFTEDGIVPFVKYLETNNFDDAHVFAKRIGLAEAYLCAYGDAERVYADVITNSAVAVLSKNDIKYEAKKIVPDTKNDFDTEVQKAQSNAHAYGLIYKKLYPDTNVIYFASDNDDTNYAQMHNQWHPEAQTTASPASKTKYIDVD